jgi:phosphoribosylglycinamide formyltransferase-1
VRFGVLASHEGTTLQAILDAFPGSVVVVISNNAEAGALARARAAAVPGHHLSTRTHPDPAALDTAIAAALQESAAELVVLAGYMRKLGPRTLSAFRHRIVNTHPALLPKFGGQGLYGLHVHRAVLAAGETVTGASVHWVDAEYDTGPVIARREVAVAPDDTPETLAARVQEQERALLIDVLAGIARGEIVHPMTA